MLDVHAPLSRALATPVLLAPTGHKVLGVSAPGALRRNTKEPSTYDWRAPRGSEENLAGTRAELERRSLGEVLSTRYAKEAHFAGYLVMQQGDVLERAPRVCKDALPWLRQQGYDCWTTCFLADVDTPRAAGVRAHRPWDEGLREELDRLWTSGAPILSTCGIYLSPHGYRLVQPLVEPLPSDEAEPRLRAWLEALKAAGCWANITVVKDWTRLMRTPLHRRPTGFVEPAWVDYSRMVPFEPPEAPPVAARAKRAPRKAIPVGVELDTCPAAWVPVAEAVGRAIEATVTERYRECYLALAGALSERGCPSEALGAVLGATRRVYAGWELHRQNRAEIGRDTARRLAAGLPVLAGAALRRSWPAVAAALDEACAAGGELGGPVPAAVQAVREQLGGERAEVSVAEATATLGRVLRDAYGLQLVAAPPGLGKSEAVLRLAEGRGPVGERARPGQRIGLTVPTHDLAAQLAARARAKGIPVARLFGPLAHLGPDGKPTCIYHDRAEALARGGHSVAKVFCRPEEDARGQTWGGCERYEGCPAREGVDSDPGAVLLIAPHELLGRVTRELGVAGTLAIDEPPPAVDVVPLSLDDLDGARRHLDATQQRYRRRIAPALEALTAWVRHAEAGEALVVSEAIERGLPWVSESILAPVTDPEAPQVADVLEDARRATEGDEGDRRGLAAPLTTQARTACRRIPARAAEVGAATEVLLALSRALRRFEGVAEARVTVEGSEDERRALVALPNERLLAACRREAGTVVLDAGVADHAQAFAALAGYQPPVVDLWVPDGCEVERVVLATASATRRALVPRGVPDWQRIAGLLRHALAWCAEGGDGATPVLVSWKVVEAGLLHALGRPEAARGVRLSERQIAQATEVLGPLLAPVRDRVLTGHYENLRGLDHLRDADALVTLGDPRRNLGVEAARAAWIGEDASGRVEALAASELDQAHGRLRTIHRTKPARMLHVGSIVPCGWRSRRVTARAIPEGRPPTVAAMAADELVRAREALGMSARAFAATLNLNDRAVRRYESGERGIPGPIAAAVRVLVRGAAETPDK